MKKRIGMLLLVLSAGVGKTWTSIIVAIAFFTASLILLGEDNGSRERN